MGQSNLYGLVCMGQSNIGQRGRIVYDGFSDVPYVARRTIHSALRRYCGRTNGDVGERASGQLTKWLIG